MKYPDYEAGMRKLYSAFGLAINDQQMATFWERLRSNTEPGLFAKAVDTIIDAQDRFPSVKQLRDAYWEQRKRHGDYVARLETPEDAWRQAATDNVARFKRDGLKSDRMMAEATERGFQPTYHPPGSRTYDGWVKTINIAINGMERRLNELGALMEECDDPMDQADLERRFAAVSGAYSELSNRYLVFMETGRMPPAPGTDSLPEPTGLYACWVCSDTRFVRVDVTQGSRFFGEAIPCPHCNGAAYHDLATTYGAPGGMPEPWSAQP